MNETDEEHEPPYFRLRRLCWMFYSKHETRDLSNPTLLENDLAYPGRVKHSQDTFTAYRLEKDFRCDAHNRSKVSLWFPSTVRLGRTHDYV